MVKKIIWNTDFLKFKKKVERLFGPLEMLAKDNPQIYAHMVLSHGFMEYCLGNDLPKKIKEEVAGSEESFNKLVNGKETEQKRNFHEKYDLISKREYLNWAKQNQLSENLIEMGWQEYLND